MSTIIGKVVSSSVKSLSRGARSVTKEISATKSYLSTSAKNGWACGQRLSNIKGLTPVEGFYTKTKGAIRQTKVRKQDLPALGGLIGTISPFPGGTVIGYGIGKLLQFLKK